MHEKILIQSKFKLDIPMNKCPGDTGVIYCRITVMTNRKGKEANVPKEKKKTEAMQLEANKTLIR